MGKNEQLFYKKESIILKRRDPITCIGLIQSGTVSAEFGKIKVTLSENDVIGILDGNQGGYLAEYTALEDCRIRLYSFESPKEYRELFHDNYELTGNAASSAMRQIVKVGKQYHWLDKMLDTVAVFIKYGYTQYQLICKEFSIKPLECAEIASYTKMEWGMGYAMEIKTYFENLATMPEEFLDDLFNQNDNVAYFHIFNASQAIAHLCRACDVLLDSLEESVGFMCSDNHCNLLHLHMELLKDRILSKLAIQKLLKMMKQNVDLLFEIEQKVQERYSTDFLLEGEKYINTYKSIVAFYQSSFGGTSLNTEGEQDENLTDIMERLISYALLDSENAEVLRYNMKEFRKVEDKYSSDEYILKVRKQITDVYYTLYELVFFKFLEDKKVPLYVQLFLDFGLTDEHLLEEETIRELAQLDHKVLKDAPIQVYRMSEWLEAIYYGSRQPSKNEFNIDYVEQVCVMRRKQQINDQQQREYLEDGRKKVKYEIDNMFRINGKVTFGQITSFCPVLKQDDIIGDVKNMLVNSEQINFTINDILEIDYSVFYREYMYDNREIGIHNTILRRQVLPIAVLMPNAGHGGSMWQEIEGKRRDTPARFMLPILTRENLYHTLVRLCGVFRWEMCKTMQGNYWNDISERSLTSEYCDYVQFYKRNRELSERTKEKLSNQLRKCRNNFRETFVMDYGFWIKSEAHGSIGLNKISRGILATYCPFKKPIREKLQMQPLYVEAEAKFERMRVKKVKELSMRRAALASSPHELPQELKDEIRFFEEL